MNMQDESFSNVTWDENKRTGKMTLANGKTANLEIDFSDDEPLPEVILNSVQFVIANEPQIRYKIAASMTELYKDWNDNETITPEQLAQKIHLTNVDFYDDGCGQLSYEPEGNIFTDHCICVPFDANGEIDEPSLEG
jgi:hypothetical protein